MFLGVLGLANLVGFGALIVAAHAGGLLPQLFSNVTWAVTP